MFYCDYKMTLWFRIQSFSCWLMVWNCDIDYVSLSCSCSWYVNNNVSKGNVGNLSLCLLFLYLIKPKDLIPIPINKAFWQYCCVFGKILIDIFHGWEGEFNREVLPSIACLLQNLFEKPIFSNTKLTNICLFWCSFSNFYLCTPNSSVVFLFSIQDVHWHPLSCDLVSVIFLKIKLNTNNLNSFN